MEIKFQVEEKLLIKSIHLVFVNIVIMKMEFKQMQIVDIIMSFHDNEFKLDSEISFSASYSFRESVITFSPAFAPVKFLRSTISCIDFSCKLKFYSFPCL